MTILQAMILGVVQGLTEFLPVSSSGHLVLVEHLLNVRGTEDITFEVFVHFGTLLSVVVVLWKEIVKIVQSFSVLFERANPIKQFKENEYLRLALYILVGTVPAAVVGMKFEESVASAFTDPKLVAVMLVLTGLILFLTRLVREARTDRIGVVSAIVIGLAQAAAIIPGISRSGSTISTGMFLGVSPVVSARFSFLLSIPVIAGATFLKSLELFEHGAAFDYVLPILVGTVVSFFSGFFAIKFLLKIIEKGQFSFFSFYCLFVGTLGIIFL